MSTSRVNEFVFRVANGQHRAGGLADDFLGDTAQEHVYQPTVAVRAHDDQLDAGFPGEPDDLVKRGPFPHFLVMGPGLPVPVTRPSHLTTGITSAAVPVRKPSSAV